MRAIYSLLLVLLLSKAAAGQSDFDQITNHMAQQSKAWNTGDVSGFMDYYWKSDSLRFIGKRGITWGWQSTFDNYKKSYPDKAAMGTLKFGVKSHEYLAQDKVLTIGTWELTYPTKEPVGGIFTLIWRKIDGAWKIVLDHTS